MRKLTSHWDFGGTPVLGLLLTSNVGLGPDPKKISRLNRESGRLSRESTGMRRDIIVEKSDQRRNVVVATVPK